MVDVKLTIFTPTYNRKSKLVACFDSLQKQCNSKFIWQVIDDGSTDGTGDLIESFREKANFEIHYLYVENGGKYRAINKSLLSCDTDLWMCLDSDDTLLPNAVETLYSLYPSIVDKDEICGFFSLRGSSPNKTMQGKRIPNDVTECTQSQVRYKHNITPEYCHVFKTSIIKCYPYPEVEGENYFPLSYVFDQIDTKYKYHVIHGVIMLCEYLDSGITKNKRSLIANNPKGYMLYKKQLISLAPNRKERIKATITYITGCLLAKLTPFQKGVSVLSIIILYPFAFFDYILRYKFEMNLDMEIKTRKNGGFFGGK